MPLPQCLLAATPVTSLALQSLGFFPQAFYLYDKPLPESKVHNIITLQYIPSTVTRVRVGMLLLRLMIGSGSLQGSHTPP